MTQNSRRMVAALAGLLLIGSLSACGDDGEAAVDAAATEGTAATAAAETTEAAATETTATVISYQLTDTGQTAFYDSDGNEIEEPVEGEALYGQDAAYEGVQMSYTDNGDGTVTDNVTGLIWEQDPTEDGTTWYEAQDYCESLELAGIDDWRTPSLTELFSISDFGTGWPYIDTDYFNLVGDAGESKDQQYWSSNHYEVDTELAAQDQGFGVNHATGHIKAYPDGAAIGGEGDEAMPPPSDGSPEGAATSDDAAESSEGMPPPPGDGAEGASFGDSNPATKYVRCVSGDDYGVNDFVDNGDGTVTDEAAGLMWASADSGEGMDWESALGFAVTANEENYLGYSDWRVPDVKELQSIVDYTGSYPAIDEEFFTITDEDSYFWTSTSAYFSPQSPGYYYAWYVAFGYAVDGEGNDSHGAGAVRFDTKVEGGPAGEEPERIYNYVRLVRDA